MELQEPKTKIMTAYEAYEIMKSAQDKQLEAEAAKQKEREELEGWVDSVLPSIQKAIQTQAHNGIGKYHMYLDSDVASPTFKYHTIRNHFWSLGYTVIYKETARIVTIDWEYPIVGRRSTL